VRACIWWTAERLEKIASHHVSRDEVASALSRTVYWRHARGRIIVIGKTSNRYLFVVLEPSTAQRGWQEVVTARTATHSEKQLFARRRKGH
jgi:uncharacterized DUF497 family protein